MKILALALTGVAAIGLSACQQGAETNDATVVGGTNEVVEQTNGNVMINTDAIGNRLENAAEDVGNFASNVGNSIENGAEAVGTEARQESREVEVERPVAEPRR